MTALWGIIGVLVGSLLTAFWQRRNWQRQKLLEGYARFLQAGVREFGLVFQVSAPPNSAERRWLAKGRLGGRLDSVFLAAGEMCFMLERDPALRDDVRKLIDSYEKFREHVMAEDAWDSRPEEQSETQKVGYDALLETINSYREPHKEALDAMLHQLRENVTERYFR